LSNDADGGSKPAASAATISLLIVTSVKDWNTAALEVIVMQGLDTPNKAARLADRLLRPGRVPVRPTVVTAMAEQRA
jgi:hypothetical protein